MLLVLQFFLFIFCSYLLFGEVRTAYNKLIKLYIKACVVNRIRPKNQNTSQIFHIQSPPFFMFFLKFFFFFFWHKTNINWIVYVNVGGVGVLSLYLSPFHSLTHFMCVRCKKFRFANFVYNFRVYLLRLGN